MVGWLLIGLAALVLLFKLSRYGMRPKDYPPGEEFAVVISAEIEPNDQSSFTAGPPTIPVLGNLHQMPASNLHLHLQKWAEECRLCMALRPIDLGSLH